jgi:hypothetical protein
MAGSQGVNVTAWGANWAGATTYVPAPASATAIPTATTQWQVCFKCHSGANSQLASWNSGWTNLALEFNPNNASFHPVVAPLSSGASTVVAAAQLTSGWKPGDVMYCSDCHGNDDTTNAASQGPHASAVKFILRGPNTRWPFQNGGTTRWTTSNYTTSSGTANGLFCLNCHALSGVHTRGEHVNTACTSCHIQIPHGGKVKRLIRTTNTPAPYADTGSTAQLKSYAGGSSDGSTSCGANCTTHHNLTPSATNSW